MSITDARLTQSGGLRGLQAGAVRVMQDYSEVVPPTVLWKGVGVIPDGHVPQDLDALNVSWWYDWSNPSLSHEAAPGFEYVPMMWGDWELDERWELGGPPSEAIGSSTTLLGFNEPELAGQANMTVARALALWPQLEATGARLGSPAISGGGTAWLASFMAASPKVDFICLHWYADTDGGTPLGTRLDAMHDAYGLPIWLTETGNLSGGVSANASLIPTIIDTLTTRPWVERVAWFTVRNNAGWSGTELINGDGTLNAAGTAYASYPPKIGEEVDEFVGYRTFDGVDDRVVLAIAESSGTTYGPHSQVALVRQTSGTAGYTILTASTSGGTRRGYFYTYNRYPSMDTDDGYTGDVLQLNHNEWYLIGCNKASGSQPVRFHRFRFSDSSWGHANGTGGTVNVNNATGSPGAGGEWRIGAHPPVGDGEYWVGDIAAVAYFDKVLTDAEFETLDDGLSNWLDLAPVHCWRLDQTSISDLVGSADQTSMTGTVLSTDDSPLLVTAAFSPATLPNLVGWWDAADASTFTYGTGSAVSQWNDKSGLGRHLVQATAGQRPTRDGDINGTTTLRFVAASSQWMYQSATFSPTVAQPFTTAIVTSAAPTASDEGWIGGTCRFYRLAGGPPSIYAGSLAAGASSTLDGDHVWFIEWNQAASKLYRDGIDLSYPTTSIGTDGISNDFCISRRSSSLAERYVNGEIGEIIIYNRLLTSTERADLTDHLMDKWGL